MSTLPLLVRIGCFLLVGTAAVAATAEERVTSGLLALYDFEERSGTVVRDRAATDEPLDLEIGTPSTARWHDGALAISGSATIASKGPARRINQALQASRALTIEAWIKPENHEQKGPARIVTLSADTSQRNVTLGQDAERIDVRLRASSTNANGLPSLASPDKLVAPKLMHIVYTRAANGEAKLYVDGKAVANRKIDGNLDNWDGNYRLALANELTGDRPWRGELHLVAIYGRALTAEEVAQNLAAGSAATAIDYARLLPPAVERKVDFVKDVQPILRARCFECHAEGNEEGGLNLGIRARVFEGGDHGAVLVAGKSAASRLVHLVAGIEPDAVMPPEGESLSREEIGILRAWIDQGAPWPEGADVLNPRLERAREHWAFQPLREVPLPAVKDEDWVRTPIDRFVLARLEAAGLRPTPPLEPRKLMRRVSFDMVGLPPEPEALEKFAAATDRERAYSELVDAMLASPHFGERWGRHWLDVARYADSNGQEGDQDRPHAWRYRDFVIQAINDDLPFDTFVRWQLAGDEYEPQNPQAAIATGFLVAGPHTVLADTFLEEERLQNRYNELDDMLSTIGGGMLGLTIGCARCHDHKYDAISAREYYRLLAALHSGNRADVKLDGDIEALVFRDFGSEPRPTWLFGRGDFYDRDRPVTLGFLEVLQRGKSVEDYWKGARASAGKTDSTLQRKALAEWMTDVEHGAGALVARVIVNRVWQHHFGEGLVRTPGDFGVRGEAPTHPELLEWLANDLVANGWKLKRLHRMILASAVYQQGTTFDAQQAKIDPENRLLWRMRPRRIEAEIVRDAILAASGTLQPQVFGPAFKPPIADEAKVARNLQSPYPDKVEDGPENHRRSVYMFHKRVIPYPLLQAFDRPDSLQSCSRRDRTTVAPQALALLNDPFVRARSIDFAARLERECAEDNHRAVRRAFELALGRPPAETEEEKSVAFVEQQIARRRERDKERPAAEVRRLALADFCQAVMSLNEFLYIE